MADRNREPKSTRERVLESACAVFSEKGYRDATIADICGHAGANVAAVNYYFKDKETLYEETLRHAFDLMYAAYPIDRGTSEDAPAAEKLRAFIETMLRRILGSGPPSYFPRLMIKEMGEPTQAHDRVVPKVMEPHRRWLHAIVRELLGPEATDRQVHLCAFSVISQCLFLNFHTTIRRHFVEREGDAEERIVVLSHHVARFCMAGIAAASNAGKETGT